MKGFVLVVLSLVVVLSSVGRSYGHEQERNMMDNQDKVEIGYKRKMQGVITNRIEKFKNKLIGGHDGIDMPKKKKLIGQPDGHESNYHIIGNKDGHESNHPMLGRPDGHEIYHKIDEGGLEEDFHHADGDEEEPLVRCKRPQCNETLSCSFGSKTDHMGCNICECLKDPCQGHSCEVGYACDIIECKHGKKCDALGFRCIRKQCDGPVPMCSNECQYGYALNEFGCDTCICRLPPESEGTDEKEGVKIDDGGIEPDEGDSSDDEEDNSEDEEEDEEEEGSHRFNPKYGISDPNAHACLNSCHDNQFCDTEEKDCKKRTLCWLHQLSKRSKPSCRHTLWTFTPLQCSSHPHRCWCVDSIGRMIDHTIVPIVNQEQIPICKTQTVSSVTVRMQYSMIGEGTGEKRLDNSIVDTLERISTAPASQMTLSLASRHSNLLLYDLKLKNSNQYDLAYAAEVIRLTRHLTFNSETVKVKQSSRSRITKVDYEEGEKDVYKAPTIDLNWEEISRDHLTSPVKHGLPHGLILLLFITFVIMATMVFIMILVLVCRRCMRRRGSGIRHHPLRNQFNTTLDPTKLMRAPLKSDSVVLVDDDALDKARVA